jgi:hypothetical protein
MIVSTRLGGLPAFPIPVPDGMPQWLVNALFIGAGIAVFVVLLWQTVRYFREDRDDRDNEGSDPEGGDAR